MGLLIVVCVCACSQYHLFSCGLGCKGLCVCVCVHTRAQCFVLDQRSSTQQPGVSRDLHPASPSTALSQADETPTRVCADTHQGKLHETPFLEAGQIEAGQIEAGPVSEAPPGSQSLSPSSPCGFISEHHTSSIRLSNWRLAVKQHITLAAHSALDSRLQEYGLDVGLVSKKGSCPELVVSVWAGAPGPSRQRDAQVQGLVLGPVECCDGPG